ncbi:MAG: hypothetical protein AB7F22_25145, partial [Reyranella sp.]
PITPMLFDIMAVWGLYGANVTTRTEDNTYFGPAVDGTTRVYPYLFNRSSDQAGLDYWTGQVKGALQAGQFVGLVLINIMSGAQDTAAGQDITTLMGKVAVSLAYVQEQQEHNTMWLGASDIAAATNLLDPVGSDPTSVLTGIRNAEALIAAHPLAARD